MHRRITITLTTGLAALGLAAAALAGPATAAPVSTAAADAVERREGTTRIAVAPAMVRKLSRLGVTASPTNGADAIPYEGTVAFRFPITGFGPSGYRIYHVGGVKLESPTDYVTIKALTLRTYQRTVAATVVVNGEQIVEKLRVFKVRNSNRPRLGDFRVVLNRGSANGLNRTFGVSAFQTGENFGFGDVIIR